MTRRAVAVFAGATALLLAVGCRAPDPEAPGRRAGVAPVGSGAVVVSPGPELVALAEKVRPALVRLRVEPRLFKPASRYFTGLVESVVGVLNPHPYWDWPYRVLAFPLYLLFGAFDLGDASGSGVFVTDSLVLTCAHVVENSARIHCDLTDGRWAEGVVAAIDEERDLALVQVVGLPGERPEPVPLRAEPARPGEPVLAMGFPGREVLLTPVWKLARVDEGRERPNPTVTFGIVSAAAVELGNPSTRYVETDAALNPGSSGGPIMGLDGRLVGVATMVGAGKENEGYAVPASTVLEAFGAALDGEGRRDH